MPAVAPLAIPVESRAPRSDERPLAPVESRPRGDVGRSAPFNTVSRSPEGPFRGPFFVGVVSKAMMVGVLLCIGEFGEEVTPALGDPVPTGKSNLSAGEE